MAGNIKGITIEFNGDTTRLDRALRQVRNSTKDIDSELRNVNRALKFNPTSVELWRQKQDLLNQKISQTETNLKQLRSIQAQMDAQGVDKQSEAYRTIQREIIETESKLKAFKTELNQIGNVNLRAASEQFKEWGTQLENAGRAMQGISMAAAAVATSIGALAVKSGQWADDLNTMSKQYSIGTGDLQKYAAAADLVDVSVETIAKSHMKLEKNMLSASQGSKNTEAAFKALGVEYKNTDGSLRDGDQVFTEVISALGKMENETERDAYAMQLMGRSASELNPLIEDNGETYKNVSDIFSQYGLDYIDQETLDQANAFNDSLDTIKAIGLVTFQQLGTQLAGYLAPALEQVVTWVGNLAQWLSQLSPQTLAVIGTIATVLAVVAPLLISLGKVATGISAIMNLMAILGPAIGGLSMGSLLPIIAVIGAVVAAGVLLYKNWDKIKETATKLKDWLTQTWSNIKTTVSNFATGLKNAVTGAWDGLKARVTSVTDAMRSALSSAWSNISGTASSIWSGITGTVTSLMGRLSSTVSSVFSSLWSTAARVWGGIRDAITSPIHSAWQSLVGTFNRIAGMFPIRLGNIFNFKTPSISIGSKTVEVGDKKVTVPTFNVSWHKLGGIFTKATLLAGADGRLHGVGEAGPEAILPLNELWKHMAEMNQGVTINVYASQGMDVNELAVKIEQRLILLQKQRAKAYGTI